jgi:hypothetical protein
MLIFTPAMRRGFYATPQPWWRLPTDIYESFPNNSNAGDRDDPELSHRHKNGEPFY